jgi:hypothetical protein
VTLLDFEDDDDKQPPINAVTAEQEVFDVPQAIIQPQGTTRRPVQGHGASIPSLADLSTTTPRPSQLLQETFLNVPGTNLGIYTI